MSGVCFARVWTRPASCTTRCWASCCDGLTRRAVTRRGQRPGCCRAAVSVPPRFGELRHRHGLSEYAAHKHSSLDRECWIRGHLDANTAQKTATEAWRAVEQHMYGKRCRPRFRRRGELRSVEGKKPEVGIRLLDGGAVVAWDGGHARLCLPLLLDERDVLHRAAFAAPVRYLRLVRREVRGSERYPRAPNRTAPPQQIQRQIRQTAPDFLPANANARLERPHHTELRADGRSHTQDDTNTIGRHPPGHDHAQDRRNSTTRQSCFRALRVSG
jgi:hypothetical protein